MSAVTFVVVVARRRKAVVVIAVDNLIFEMKLRFVIIIMNEKEIGRIQQFVFGRLESLAMK